MTALFTPGPGGRDSPSLPQLRLPALQETGGEWGHVCLQDPSPGAGWGLKGEVGMVAPCPLGTWLSSPTFPYPRSNQDGLVED